MESITFFNNKGGVGKTTLCCNVASYLAEHHRLRVLLVDCDPQCNSTRLVLGDEACEKLYYDDSAADKAATLLTVLKPILDGDSGINSAVEPIDATRNRFNVDVLPGHPELAMLEDILSDAWGKVTGGNIEGLRRTHWATFLLRRFSSYDVVIFDVGPSLGALNRSVLVGTGTFVTPMGSDIFSIVGVRNIGKWLHSWLIAYAAGIDQSKKIRPDVLNQYHIPETLSVAKGFVGYTTHLYITKSIGGTRRATSAYENIIREIPGEVERNLGQFVRDGLDMSAMKLGDVPHLFSLIPLAQAANAPIHGLESTDGLVGSQYSASRHYKELIDELTHRLIGNIKLGRTR